MDVSLTFVVVAGLSALALAAGSAHTSSFAPAGASEDKSSSGAAADGRPYAPPAVPADFRSWSYVKAGPSAALIGQPAGTHHIWANPAAAQGMRSGVYADGAVLVFDVTPSADPSDPQRLRTDVMVRDATAYATTGGWGYGEWLFAPAPAVDRPGEASGWRVNRAVAGNPAAICHACHVRLASDRAFVVAAPAASGTD